MAQEAKQYPLGSIGGTYQVTSGSSIALVAQITAGEPGATAGLQVNDSIYGAFGKVFTPTGDYHYGVTQELGFSVDRAESGDGVLPLMILRPGAGGMTVNVNLAATGAFGVAYPRNSPKYAAMYETAVAALHTRAMNSNGNMGYLTGWTGLALLGHPDWNSTTGDKPYRLSINKIRDSIITRLNASIYAPFEPYLLPTAPGQLNGGANPNINYADTGFSNWELGPMVMFLAEYHAKTSDATAATTLQRGTEMCANSIQWWKQPAQNANGFSPEYAQVAGMVGHNGVNGDYIHLGWYCGINMCGAHGFNGMAFARRAGMNMSVRPKDGHYFGYTLNQGDTIPAGVAGCLPSSITLPQYGADPVRGSTITDPFWYDMSVHQKFVMGLNFLVRRSARYTLGSNDDGMVGYAPEAIGPHDAGGRVPGALLGMAMYQQDVGGLDSADLARLESLKGYIARNYMRHQEAHAFCVGAQCFQAMCTPYLSDRQQRFFMDNWRFFFALSRTNTNEIKYFPSRSVNDNYLDSDHCASINIALPYAIANGDYSLIPAYNTNRTLANFKSPALMWPQIAARAVTVNAASQPFTVDVCDGEGNVLAPGTYTAAWSFVSGPSTATFTPNNAANTTIGLPSVSATAYRVRLTITRAGFPTLTEDIDITRANASSPVANAITTQPLPQASYLGGNVSFTVAVSGTGPFLYQWRLNGVPYWGASTSPTLQLTNVGINSAGSYDCVISTPGAALTSAAAPLTISTTLVRKKGGLKRESWYGVAGGSISDLTNNANYPLFPSATGMVSAAETGVGSSTSYGQKLSGWVTPPVSGPYKFYLTSNDASQLWLSTDSTAANLVKIAEVGAYVGFRAYSSGGRSVQINLVAGQKYYLEILHKKGGGPNDHVSVAWQFPGEGAPADGSAPIDGVYLEYDQSQEPFTNYWKFDEASGASCIDSAGGATATLHNSPARINDGVMNGALSFNGVNQYAKAVVPIPTNAYAVSLWFRTSQANGGMFAVTAEDGGHDRLIYLSGGNIHARTWSDEIISSTGKAYGDGQWHHVVHTYGGAVGGQKLYVDGALVASGSKSQSDFNWATAILIGDSVNGSPRYFNGSIDDVRLYGGALTAQDVTALYQDTIAQGSNAAPQIATNTLTVADGAIITTPIGTITATDANAGQTLTYSLIGGNVGNRFALDAAIGLLTVNGPLDYGVIPVYLLTVRVTDNGSPAMSTDAIVTVNLTQTNDPPGFWVDPMAMGGLKDVAISGMLAATDPDAGDTLTYSKVSGPAWLTVAANGVLGGIPSQSDLGANSFVVRVTDAGGLSDDAVLNIGVSENTIWTNPAGGSWLVTGNWQSGTIANGTGFTANFSTLNPTADVIVNLDADRTIGNLAFGDTDTATAAGWTIAGNKLTLASATGTPPVVTVDALGSGKEAAISSILMGTQGFVKAGAGILNLSGDNNGYGGITGGIVVNNGILKLNRGNGTIRGTLTVNSGGEVRQNASWSLGTDGGTASSAFTNTININGGILNFAVLGGGLVANVNMTGGEIKSVGNGTVDWYNTPVGGCRTLTTSASGGTALVSSGLQLRMGNNAGGTNIFDVADGGAAIDFKISGGISETTGGTQNLLKKGAGTMELSNGNSFAGSTKVAAGVLKLTHNLALQSSALDTGGAGTVTLGTTTLSLGGLSGGTDLASVITSGYTGSLTALTLNTYTSKTLFYSGVIANGATGMTLTKSGSGTQVLSGANTYTGGTIISGGKLIMTSAANLGNGALNVGGNTFIYATAAAGTLNIGSGVLTLTNNGTIGTALGGTASQSAITSTGTASLSGTGKVNIYGINGVSPTAGTNNLITAGSGLTGGTYTLGTVFNNTDFTVSNFQRTAGAISVDVAAATALTGNVSWKGGLTGNTGVWAASTGSTQSNWQVTDGVNQALAPGATTDLVFSTATSPGTMAGMSLGANMTVKTLTINNTATAFGLNADGFTLTLAPASSAAGITVAASVQASTVAANVALGADQTWTNNSANTMTVSGTVSGAYALTKAGTGQITLSGNNTYTGATTVSTGTLVLSGINSFTGATTIASGATLTISGAGQLGAGSYAGNIANAGTLNWNGATDQTLSGIISGAGVLVKFGDGRDSKLTLTGVNTYTGATSFYRGSLEIGGAGQLNSGNYAGTITTDSNASWAGTLYYNSTANQTLSGVISGVGSLTKMNSSTLTLSVANTFSGITKVEAGVLALTHNQAIQNSGLDTSGAGVVTVTGTTPTIGGLLGGNNLASVVTTGYGSVTALTLNLKANAAFTYYGVIANGAANMTLTKSNTASTQILSGINTYSGATTISGGTLEIGGAGQLGYGSYAANISISNGNTGRFFYNSTANQTLGGVISGNGALVKAQASTLTLNGLNAYTGATTVSAGSLVVNGSLNAASAVTVASTATLSGTGTVNGTVMANGLIAPGSTAAAIGTLTIGVPTFSATSQIVAQINSDSFSADRLAVTGALALHASSQLNLSDVGSTSLTAGTKLVLLTYTGAWNSVPFSGKADDSTVIVGINTFTINYDDNYSGNNAVTLTAIGSDPYDAWVGMEPGGFGLTGADALKDADPDGDGAKNLLEFATNSDPTSGSSGPRTYPAMVTIGGDKVLTYTIAVRKGDESAFVSPAAPNAAKKTATRDNVKYTVEASDNLGVWNTEVVTEVTDVGEISDVHGALGDKLTAPAIGTAWEWKTFRAGAGVVTTPRDFIRLHVTEDP